VRTKAYLIPENQEIKDIILASSPHNTKRGRRGASVKNAERESDDDFEKHCCSYESIVRIHHGYENVRHYHIGNVSFVRKRTPLSQIASLSWFSIHLSCCWAHHKHQGENYDELQICDRSARDVSATDSGFCGQRTTLLGSDKGRRPVFQTRSRIQWILRILGNMQRRVNGDNCECAGRSAGGKEEGELWPLTVEGIACWFTAIEGLQHQRSRYIPGGTYLLAEARANCPPAE
jgi:hypothetical protein